MEPLKAYAVIDKQKTPRWTYRLIDNKKSGVAIFFTKPKIPKEWKHLKSVIPVSITPLTI